MADTEPMTAVPRTCHGKWRTKTRRGWVATKWSQNKKTSLLTVDVLIMDDLWWLTSIDGLSYIHPYHPLIYTVPAILVVSTMALMVICVLPMVSGMAPELLW